MFNIIWEFIINLLESFLFAVICNAKFTKRQYHYHTAEQTLFILCKSLLITLMNISKISTIISLTSVLLLVNSNPRIPFVTQDSLFVNENPVL